MERHRVVLVCGGLLVGCAEDDCKGRGGETAETTATASSDGSTDTPPVEEPGNPGGEVCASLSDEFDDPATLDCWIDYDPSLYTRLDVDRTTPGNLTLEPVDTDGWFEDGDGPYLYKLIDDSFVVEIHVAAVDRDAVDAPPSQRFNSAGFVVRDPSSAPERENWLMYNLGYQDNVVGTEGKTTTDSSSVLTILPGLNQGRLRICRLGAQFQMLRWLDDEDGWTLEHTFMRPDLPERLQVGLVGNGYAAPPDLRAQFDYVRFAHATDASACTAAF